MLIGGTDNVKVPLDDLRNASELLVRALLIRKKYMNMSSQQFPTATERFLQQISETTNTTDHDPANVPYQTGLRNVYRPTSCMTINLSIKFNKSINQSIYYLQNIIYRGVVAGGGNWPIASSPKL